MSFHRQESRANELEALQAILENNIKITDNRIRIQVYPNLNGPVFGLNHLPPAILLITLPEQYPEEPPKIEIDCFYHDITTESIVSESGECNLYEIYENVLEQLENITEDIFSEQYNLHKDTLKNYDSARKTENFNKMIVACDFCYGEYLGKVIIRCSDEKHNFCNDCTKNFLRTGIEDFKNFKLTSKNEPSCILCSGPENALLSLNSFRIFSEKQKIDLFDRFDMLLLEQSLGKEFVTEICPSKACKKIIYLTKEESKSSEFQCPYCGDYYCKSCQRSSHSPLSCEDVISEQAKFRKLILEKAEKIEINKQEEKITRNQDHLLTELLSQIHDMDWPGLNIIEELNAIFSKTSLTMTLDKLSNRTMDDHFDRCPECNVCIEKNGGCNHMICLNCGHHFQYKFGRLRNNNY